MPTLIAIEGPAAGKKFALEQHRVVMLGRDAGCTFQIVDPRLSRMHLQLKRMNDEDRHIAIDFDSHNGVMINDVRIDKETPLQDGDQIRLGDTLLIYSVDDSGDAIRNFEAAHRIGEGHVRTITGDALNG